jgi:phage baseplate assembly protein W
MSTVIQPLLDSSDYNNPKGRPAAKSVGSKTLYSDLNLKLRKGAGKDDITPLYDIDAIKNSLKNLILTNYGDRPFHPEIGCNISSLLFEPVDEYTAVGLQEEIKVTIGRNEPRVNLLVTEIQYDEDKNSFYVTLGFRLSQGSNIEEEVSFYLERLR